MHGKIGVDADHLHGQIARVGVDRDTGRPPGGPDDRVELGVRRARRAEATRARGHDFVTRADHEHEARAPMTQTVVLGIHKRSINHEREARVAVDRDEARAEIALGALGPTHAAHVAAAVAIAPPLALATEISLVDLHRGSPGSSFLSAVGQMGPRPVDQCGSSDLISKVCPQSPQRCTGSAR